MNEYIEDQLEETEEPEYHYPTERELYEYNGMSQSDFV